MVLVTWREDYRVGVSTIDSEHRYLIGLINEFYDAHASGRTAKQILGVLTRLVAYAEEHFQHEEALMKQTDYPRLAHQQKEHEILYSSIYALNEKLARNGVQVDIETLRFLKRWLIDHILKDDLDIGDFLRRKAVQAEKAARQESAGGRPPTDAAGDGAPTPAETPGRAAANG